MKPDTPREGPALRIEGLTLLAADTCVVQQASLDVLRSQVHALVGESGSGKTLLSRSAIGLLPQAIRRTEGKIFVAGQDVTTFTQKRPLRRSSGAACVGAGSEWSSRNRWSRSIPQCG